MHNFDIEEKNNFHFLQISSFPLGQHSIFLLYLSKHNFFRKNRCKTVLPLSPSIPFSSARANSPEWRGEKRGKSKLEGSGRNAGEIESPFRAVSRRLFRTILAGASSRRKKRGGHKWKKRRGAETRSGEDARVLPARTSAGDVCPRPADPSDVTSSISSREIPIVF